MDGRLTLGAACARARAQAPVHLDGWTGALLTAVRFAMACGRPLVTRWGPGGVPRESAAGWGSGVIPRVGTVMSDAWTRGTDGGAGGGTMSGPTRGGAQRHLGRALVRGGIKRGGA